jgi:hypothetical protein
MSGIQSDESKQSYIDNKIVYGEQYTYWQFSINSKTNPKVDLSHVGYADIIQSGSINPERVNNSKIQVSQR